MFENEIAETPVNMAINYLTSVDVILQKLDRNGMRLLTGKEIGSNNLLTFEFNLSGVGKIKAFGKIVEAGRKENGQFVYDIHFWHVSDENGHATCFLY